MSFKKKDNKKKDHNSTASDKEQEAAKALKKFTIASANLPEKKEEENEVKGEALFLQKYHEFVADYLKEIRRLERMLLLQDFLIYIKTQIDKTKKTFKENDIDKQAEWHVYGEIDAYDAVVNYLGDKLKSYKLERIES